MKYLEILRRAKQLTDGLKILRFIINFQFNWRFIKLKVNDKMNLKLMEREATVVKNRIDIVRTKKKLSYGAIAKDAKLTATYICLLAKGKRKNPSLEVMQRISETLGEKVESIFQINPEKSL